MKYILESISIIKNRWPEAAMLIVLPSILIAFSHDAQSGMAVLLLGFFVFLGILYLGFLRTSLTGKDRPQMPMVLLKEGKRFLWRFVQLYFAYVAVYFALTIVTFIILSYSSQQPISAERIKEIVMVANTAISAMLIANILVSVLFIKFILFLPALVIVNDITVPSSFYLVKYCKLKDIKALVVLFFSSIAVNLIWIMLPDLPPESKFRIIRAILPAIVNQAFALIIAVAVIRFVGSLNLLYDNQDESASDLTEGEI